MSGVMGILDSPTDAQLLAAADRDASAFRKLYERYAERIHGYMRRRSGSAEAAYDLTAETFACAWQSRGRFRDEAGGSAGPWLFGIARNVLLMSVRRGALERAAAERLGVLAASEAPAVTPAEHWLDGIDELLGELPEGQRAAVALRVIDGLDYDQVADALGTTAPSARVRVHRGLAALRRQIHHQETTR
jgi:RNA polymerase sigma-70 factor (ECF subfamily)